ncbi:hypoxanthine-guanine phosphoribosyltransferase [Simiduia agarivorans]|uniref:Hypoxanthine-guanine phosphoribosyltransferase n=1 Tax=Simiduia agarivorans (strain DSM 21679 / JCM 13881 / BCRC 17597 / SA1) TaxID=1117647 RepID=K4KHM3_SIMAS|nr:hypoxanthine-guanine phosphoribosyltransferase [Simiduia agarivorans]AFU97468.1 hypoxanthine-guanine phosphoribosyltransferase [Simiduia agarivorans SA1 = DSM 21679]
MQAEAGWALPEGALCLLDADAMQRHIEAAAQALNARFAGIQEPVLMLVVMNGGLWFAGQLLGRLHFPLELDYVHLSRYRDTTRGRELEWRTLPSKSLTGRRLLLIDDILDQGVTAQALVEHCRLQAATETTLAVMLEKPASCRLVNVQAQIVACQIPDHYVFGCGMDLNGLLRNLPALYYLPEA